MHLLASAVPTAVGTLRSTQVRCTDQARPQAVAMGLACSASPPGPGAAGPRRGKPTSGPRIPPLGGGRSRAWGATSVNMSVAARELPSEGFHAIDGAVEPLHESHGQAGMSESAWAAPPSRRARRPGGRAKRPGGAGPGGRARRAAGPGGKIPIPGLLWPESRPQGVCRGSRTGRPRSRRARRTRSPATPACVSALRVLR